MTVNPLTEVTAKDAPARGDLLAAALALATLLAATWYGPNVKGILGYVAGTRDVYSYAGAKVDPYFNAFVAWVNLLSLVREGPGLPLAVVASAA